jgi:hypothetical protein
LPNISPAIKQNRSLYGAAIILLIYGLIELTDSISIVLITAGIIPNFYLSLMNGNPEIAFMLENFTILFIPIFLFFTSLRLLSAYWLFTNKAKGFWMALFVSGMTFLAVFWFMPFSVMDIIATWPVIILLFQGYLKEKPIVTEQMSD